MSDLKHPKAAQPVGRTDPKDRRRTSERRTLQIDIGHAERRATNRRQTELQALIWQSIRLRSCG